MQLDLSIISRFFDSSNEVNAALLGALVGGLSGAVFTGLVTVMVAWFGKITNRQKLHFNALVGLETHLLMLHGQLERSGNQIAGIVSHLPKGAISWNNPSPVVLDDSYFTNLLDVEVKNELLNLFYDLSKYNADVQNWQGGYNKLVEAFIGQSITPQEYVENASRMATGLSELGKFVKSYQASINKLSARVRVRMKKDVTFLMKLERKVLFWKYSEVSDQEIKMEFEKVLNEIEQSKTVSGQEISETLKST